MKKQFYNLFPSFLIMNSSLFILIFLLHLSSLSTAILCIPTERDTLLKFKHSLTDPSHRLSSWNASSISNCCLWHGVVCSNVTAHVVRLHLNTLPPNFDEYSFDEEAYERAYNRTRFGGEINPCLVDLKYLNYLDLSGNHFGRVPIPSFLGIMSSLTHLNLSHVGFMGNIPSQIANLSNLLQLDLSYAAIATIPSQIGNLSNLIYLDLGGNSLVAENLDWLSRLSKLQYLDLSYNYFLGGAMPIPSFIGTMTSLSHLDLSHAGFMGQIPYQIGNLSNLVYLDLSSYAANGTIPSQIGNLFNLVYLGLRSGLFAENVDWLSNLSKLEHLDLRGANLSKSIDWLHTVQALPSLKHLDLSECTLPDHYNEPSLLNFSSLLTLDISSVFGYPVISSVPKWIFGLTKLISLQLSDNEIQGPIPDGIQNLTLLETLDLSSNEIQGPILDGIQNLTLLETLDLSSNEIQGPIPDGIQNLTLLETLDLSDNSFSSSIPDWLYSLHHLKFLNLRGNKLRGNISDSLGNLTSLVRLDLSSNQLEGTIPTALENLISLARLDLSNNKLEGTIPTSLGNLISLVKLDLSTNQLGGTIPASWGNLTNGFGTFKNILSLDFYNNLIGGTLPKSFGKLSSLRNLHLSKNQFSGNPFESLRPLSSLSYLDIQDNHFQGVVKEDDLANLTSLKILYASGNNLTLKVGPNWLPTFQLSELSMSSWQLGPNFPSWIRSQKELECLAMSNTGILDSIPTWFWEAFSQAQYLDLSQNHIHGELATTLKHPISIFTVDLSTNNICGKLPYLSNDVYRLDISGNSLSESMGDFLCTQQGKPMQVVVLNLASNNLSGEIPDCWMIWPFLVDVNLQSNHFVGNLPPSMGSLAELNFLHMRNNSFSGIFPTIFMKTNKLISLDLGENNFSGAIPTWIGERLLDVKILRLRSNEFLGHIPNKICEMSHLQVLDLAQNNLSGNIPSCFNNLSAMIQTNISTSPLIYSDSSYSSPYERPITSVDSVLLWLKGRGDEYKNFLGLVTSIDLSNNKLLGEIPREITNLNGLNFLNLSRNQLVGHIPHGIGNMVSLQSIDFSWNQLSGEIPPSISNLSFLSMLDLSHNHLKGKIPTGTQLQTFDASNFIGNNLCGPPLLVNCSSNGKIDSYDHDGKGNEHAVNWFFVSMAFGFVVGFWIVIGPLLICRSWRYAYFHFLDDVWFKLQSFF